MMSQAINLNLNPQLVEALVQFVPGKQVNYPYSRALSWFICSEIAKSPEAVSFVDVWDRSRAERSGFKRYELEAGLETGVNLQLITNTPRNPEKARGNPTLHRLALTPLGKQLSEFALAKNNNAIIQIASQLHI